ncbi:MAG: hypothetical protein HOE69_02325 [Euryarchaeota archaeon]|jgi:hypothetical protein|nr:hypothetical protein [Euryarchaeota archaeon]
MKRVAVVLLALFLLSMIPVDSVSASNNPQVSFTVLTNGCGSTQVVPDIVQIYDDTWTVRGIIEDDAQHTFVTNVVTGQTYHVEAYSGNMLIAYQNVVASSSAHVDLCVNDKEELEVMVTSNGEPVPEVECRLFGYNHYDENFDVSPTWERHYYSPEKVSDSQGICSWEVYPTTQLANGAAHGEKYKISYILPHGLERWCNPYYLPQGGHDVPRRFELSSEQENSGVCDSPATITSQSQSSWSEPVCNHQDDHSSGFDAKIWPKVPITGVSDGLIVNGCLSPSNADREDYFTVETDDFYDVSFLHHSGDSGDVRLKESGSLPSSSGFIQVGGGESITIVVDKPLSSSSTTSYTLLFERNDALSDALIAIGQSESPQLINYGPPVVNCVDGFNTWLQFYIADPSGDLGSTTKVEIGGHLDSQVVQVGEPLSVEVDGCSDGLLEMKVIDEGVEVTSKQFAVEEFEVLGLTDNVVFINAFAYVRLSERLDQGNCISIVQVGTRSALGQAIGKAEITSTEKSTTPWYCGHTATDSIQFQAKELGSLNNMLFIKFRQGKGGEPQLIFHSNMYVLPRCSDQVATGEVDEVSSYLFVDCEGNEAGLIVYQDDGAGDLDQNSWQHINSWNEDTHMVMFTNTKMVAPSEEEVEYIDLMIPTLIKRCHESNFNLNYVQDPDPGPGGVFNFIEVVGTLPEFAESNANLERVQSGLNSSVIEGDCLVHSEYVRSVGHSIAIMPDIDDWESMAFVPATATSLSRLTDWCTEYGFRCDPVTRDSPSRWEYGPFNCQLWTAYSITIKSMEEPPDPSSFQWEGRMGFYDPANQTNWYDYSMMCFGRDLEWRAVGEWFVNFAFLLIDMWAVSTIVVSGGASILIVGVGKWAVKGALKGGFKASSRKVLRKITQIGKNAWKAGEGFDVRKFTRQFEEMKSHWKLGGQSNEFAKRIDDIADRILKLSNEAGLIVYKDGSKVFTNKQLQHIGKRMNIIIKRCDPNNPVVVVTPDGKKITVREVLLDYFDDFTKQLESEVDFIKGASEVNPSNQIKPTILELDGLAEASKKFSRNGYFPGPSKWDKGKGVNNIKVKGGQFGESSPDFLFENVLIDGSGTPTNVVLEVKTSLSSALHNTPIKPGQTAKSRQQFDDIRSWARESSDRHVVYFTESIHGAVKEGTNSFNDLNAFDLMFDELTIIDDSLIGRWEVIQKQTADLTKFTKVSTTLYKLSKNGWIYVGMSSVFDLTKIPAFKFPDAGTIGRTSEPQSLALSSSCSDETILVTYGAELDYGVLWAWINITATEIQVLHHSDCQVLVSGVQWSTPVELDENGTVVSTDSSAGESTWETVGLQYIVEDDGIFVNQPPRFLPLGPLLESGIHRADGTIIYEMQLTINEAETAPAMLRYDFSSIVNDADGTHDDLYLSVTESPNCDYRNYFYIDADGLNLSLTLIANASTDTFGDNEPHRTIPDSGFHCEVILALYDSPFTPDNFPSHDSYAQGVALTTIGIRVSDIDNDPSKSANDGNAISGISFILLLLALILFLAILRKRD